MKYLYMTIGIGLLLVAVYAFFTRQLIVGIVVVLISLFFIVQDARAMLAGRGISSLTYNAIIDQCVKKIDGGRTSIKKEDFLQSMEKIKDILSEQQFVPVVGYDCVYLQYSNEVGANNALAKISSRELKADIIQDKSTWSVRIHF